MCHGRRPHHPAWHQLLERVPRSVYEFPRGDMAFLLSNLTLNQRQVCQLGGESDLPTRCDFSPWPIDLAGHEVTIMARQVSVIELEALSRGFFLVARHLKPLRTHPLSNAKPVIPERGVCERSEDLNREDEFCQEGEQPVMPIIGKPFSHPEEIGPLRQRCHGANRFEHADDIGCDPLLILS